MAALTDTLIRFPRVTFFLGDFSNAGTNGETSEDQLVVEVDAYVSNVTANRNGSRLDIRTTFAFNHPNVEGRRELDDSLQLTVTEAEPRLEMNLNPP